MAKKRLKRNKIQANLFSWGGDSKAAAAEAFGSGSSTAGSLMQGAGAIGTIVNAAKDNAGIKDMTEEKAEIQNQASTVVKASTNDELMSEWGDYNPVKQNYGLKDVRGGSTGQRLLNTFNATTAGASAGAKMGGPYGAIAGATAGLGSALAGWFTGRSKAKKLAKKMNKDAAAANQFALKSLENKADNIATQNSLNQQASFFDFGGPLFGSGAIGFDMASQALQTKEQDAMNKQRFVSVPPSMNPKEENIEINPFAFGGDMAVNSDFSNGVTTINNGGTHEQNPNAGVQIGVDRNGTPNLVEEGEVVYDNFVFSNRLQVPDELRKKYKLKGKTFANAANALQKESQERPNDPISQRGLKKSMERLASAQEQVKNQMLQEQAAKQQAKAPRIQSEGYNPYDSLEYAYGGNLFAVQGLMDNPPYKAFLPIDENAMAEQYSLQNPFSQAPVLDKATPENAPLSTMQYPSGPALGDFRDNYSVDGEEIKVEGEPMQYTLQNIPEEYKGVSSEPNNFSPKEKATWMRYAPVAGAGLAVLSDLFSKPDYSNADRIEAASQGIQGVEFKPIGNYLSYNPLDRDFYINKMNQQAAATRRALRNSANGNQAMANALMLASDYNLTNSMGNFARQAEEYNQQQRERVEGFNRQTNQYNSEGAMRAQMANMQRDAMRMRGLTMAAQMREQIKQQRKASMSANMSNLFQGLGDIGSENEQRNWMARLAKAGATRMDADGNIYTDKGGVKKNTARRSLLRKNK